MPLLSRGLNRLRPPPSSRQFNLQVRRSLSGRDRLFKVSEEVRDALATGRPVVALETTIYTHGMSDVQECDSSR